MKVNVNITGRLGGPLDTLARALGGAGRSGMLRAAGTHLQQATFEHVAKLAATRRNKLGGTPTNYFAAAAEKIAAPSALAASDQEAVLTIAQPGFARAFRDVTIVPRAAKALAIPISPVSYGHRAAELWDRMHLFIPAGGRVIAATIGGVLTPLYVLCKKVTQKQDPSLLPSSDEFLAAAVAGARGFLGMALKGAA